MQAVEVLAQKGPNKNRLFPFRSLLIHNRCELVHDLLLNILVLRVDLASGIQRMGVADIERDNLPSW